MDDALAIEPHHARWYALHDCVPGVEVHVDPGLTWVRLPVPGWFNGGVDLTLGPDEVEVVVRAVAERFETGVGFWIGPGAPDGTEEVLRRVGFRCRKRFPAMVCAGTSPVSAVPGLAIRALDRWDEFGPGRPHPHTGPVTTELRRFEMRRREALSATEQVVELGAWLDDLLVGACLVFTSQGLGSLHDVAVLEAWRGQGIRAFLVAAAVQHAEERGCSRVCLISTAMGQSVYVRVGFREVARIAYWYRGRTGGTT